MRLSELIDCLNWQKTMLGDEPGMTEDEKDKFNARMLENTPMTMDEITFEEDCNEKVGNFLVIVGELGKDE